MDITSYLLGRKSSGGGGGGGSDLDWKKLGFDEEPEAIEDIYNYSKSIKDNWDDSVSLVNKFQYDKNIVIMPSVTLGNTQTSLAACFSYCSSLTQVAPIDIRNVTNTAQCFANCSQLKYIPVFDLSSVTFANGMFAYDEKLTDESLDNILQSCITGTNLSSKKLYDIGIYNSDVYPASRIEALPHYQEFIDAGWIIK